MSIAKTNLNITTCFSLSFHKRTNNIFTGKYFLIDKITIILHRHRYQHTQMIQAGDKRNRAAMYFIPTATVSGETTVTETKAE